MERPLIPVFAWLCGLFVTAATPGVAQTESFLGEVVEMDSGSPVEGALIVSASGARAWTDARGQFTLVFPEGDTEFAVVTSWCSVTKARLPAQDPQVVFQFQVDADRRTGERARSRGSQAKMITAEQISEMRARSLVDVLERVAPEMIGGRSSQGDRVRLSGRAGTLQGQTRPVVVMDGVVLGAAASDVLATVRPADVAYIEIQKGASGGWEYGTGGSGGVVRIVSKMGSFGHEAGFEASRCPNLAGVWPGGAPGGR